MTLAIGCAILGCLLSLPAASIHSSHEHLTTRGRAVVGAGGVFLFASIILAIDATWSAPS